MNYTQIAYLGLWLIGLIVEFFVITKKNKKINKLERIKRIAQILQKIPDFINEAEHLLKDNQSKKKWGVTKLEIVLNKIKYECIKNGVDYDEASYASEVEKILSTPQKKGVNNEKKENAEINGQEDF